MDREEHFEASFSPWTSPTPKTLSKEKKKQKQNTNGCHNAVPQVSLTQMQPLNVFGDFQKHSKGQGKFNSAQLSFKKKNLHQKSS